jgi:hypothetical protein
VTAATLRDLLNRLDAALGEPARLCVYGSGAWMLLGADERISLDLDIAGPYSSVSERALEAAALQIGLPVNPPEDFSSDHIEWVGPLRLCLAAPVAGEEVVLWQGSRLTLFTVPPADLVASRLIRYDPTDQADIQFLLVHFPLPFEEIARAAGRLPAAFRDDALVRENLDNLRRDLARWTR